MKQLSPEAKKFYKGIIRVEDDYRISTFAFLISSSENALSVEDIESLLPVYHKVSSIEDLSRYEESQLTENALAAFNAAKEKLEAYKDTQKALSAEFEAAEKRDINWDTIDSCRYIVKQAIDGEQKMLSKKHERQQELIKSAEGAKEEAAMLGLPTLTGTPAQVAWAEKIRAKWIATRPASPQTENALKRATTAGYWINTHKKILDDK